MTTPLEPLGDAPFLPPTHSAAPPLPPQPQLPNGDGFVPYLPPIRRPEPVAEQPIAFDARAMVEATKRRVESPVYGHMPSGTEEGRAAVEAARAAMKRKRARNRLIGRAVVLIMLGGIGAAGWFGYRAYQDDQDRQAAERAAKSESGALTPVGQQDQVINLLDDLNSGNATPSAGGLLGAVDDAREVVAQNTLPTAVVGRNVDWTFPPAILPTYKSVYFLRLRFDTAAPDSAYSQDSFQYGIESDQYLVSVVRSDAPGETIYTFGDHWRMSVDGSGVFERMPRAPLSTAPEPDSPFAGVFGSELVVPIEARPYVEIVSVETLEPSDDPVPMRSTVVMRLDLAGFKQAAPEVYARWVEVWSSPAASDERLIDRSVRQVRPETIENSLLDNVPFELGSEELATPAGFAVIAIRFSDNGVVAMAFVASSDENFRTYYALENFYEKDTTIESRYDDWVDAP
jgi:hypothetical protein